jgi:hypothetical protein
MNWTELLKSEIESKYAVAEGLLKLVDEDKLNWKPATGSNWMTTGQLLKHVGEACGTAFRGFVTNDWGLPEGVDMSKLTPEQMMPPAEKMATVKSVAEAKQLLAEDKRIALEILATVSEHDLATRPAPAPWDSTQLMLGQRLLQMVEHLGQHKSQLFYYLKLQGKPVNTGHLWA